MKTPISDPNANHINQLFGKHKDQDVFVCGTGTSLMGFDWTKLNDKITIALNEAVKVKGFIPTYHLFSDHNLFHESKNRYNGSYEVWPYDPKIIIICQRQSRDNFLSSKKVRDEIRHKVYQFNISNVVQQMNPTNHDLFINRTVATGGVCLAWKLGAKRIFLLGVDGYKLRLKSRDGVRDVYYHDGSSKPPEKRKEREESLGEKTIVTQDRHDMWLKQMNELKDYLVKHGNPYPGPFPNNGIYNCSLLSTITTWEKIDISRVLQ